MTLRTPVNLALLCISGLTGWALRPGISGRPGPDSTTATETLPGGESGHRGHASPLSSRPQAGTATDAGTASTGDSTFSAQRAMIARLNGMDAAAARALLPEINATLDQVERRMVREVLYMKLAKEDPEGSLAYFRKFERGSQLQNYLRAWSLADRESAVKWALSTPRADSARTSALNLLAEVARTDPQYYFSTVMNGATGALADAVGNTHSIYAVFAELAQSDLPAAKAAIEASGDSWDRGQYSFGLTWQWSRNDPAAALAWAESLSQPEARASALEGVLLTLGHTDPAKADELYSKYQNLIRDSKQGMDPRGAIARGLAGLNWRDGLAFIHGEPEEAQQDLITKSLLPRMAEASAADWAGLLNELPESMEISAELPDLQEGLAATRALPDSPGRTRLLGQLLTRLAAGNPQEALTAASGAGASALLGDTVAEAMITLSRPAQFSEAAALLPESDRPGAYGRMASSLGETAPFLLQDFVAAAPDGPARRMAAVETADAWSRYHPATALEWVGTQPQQEQPRLLYEVADNWAAQDPWEASQWAARLPEGEQRDAAVYGLAGNLATSDPDAALAWADTIGDDGLRQRLVVSTLTDWHEADPQGALAALQRAQLPDDVRAKLASTFNGTGQP